ncbi:hypothetical protein JTE90_011354 [Oedothorax gibbosus]|uniref:Uncharacterized protein n=1 Tax=Oedothorax gibbosus TaxID=931172 RepID=A0AAV6VMQ5_9ARAC|nr:hypothetical protein JTE90_011354 [Oedothorax gibbosus]
MMTDNNNRNAGNYNDSQPYVVGILSPSTTLYIDQAPTNNGNLEPPTDLNLARRNTNSFQITSVTVQGSRKNDDQAYDSADDLDESHTDDLSSDFLDSSKADYEGYHSEDNIDELASPCGQQFIFAQLPNMVDRNMNLSIGVTPTFAAISPVAGGVTMMTSKSESPISAQVPIMNPLPNNWQRRFKVVKIVSSEPFKRGRWLCMDFKDPPADGEGRPGTNTPPTIQITNCDPDDRQDGAYLNVENFAQIYEIPINQTFSGNFVMGNQQHMYGIILPQNEFLQPVTLVQDLSLQTTNTDRNFNNLVNHNSLQSDPIVNNQTQPPVSTVVNIQSQQPVVNNNHLPMVNSQPVVGALINNQSPPVGVVVNNQSPPASPKKQNSFSGQSEAVLNHINSAKVNCDSVVPPAVIAVSARSRNNSSSNSIPLSSNHALIGLNRQGSQPEASER